MQPKATRLSEGAKTFPVKIPRPYIMNPVFLWFILLYFISCGQATAQCTINTLNTTAGFTPAIPDTITQGVAYSQTEQFYEPLTYDGFTVDSIKITGFTGMPTGITYTINPASGTIKSGGNGAICFTGTTGATAGRYPLILSGFEYIHGFGREAIQDTGFLQGGLTLIVQEPPYPYGTHCDSIRSISVQITDTTQQQINSCGVSEYLIAQTTGYNTVGSSYTWNTGETEQGTTDGLPGGGEGDYGLINTIGVGQYAVTVTNTYGCTASASFNVTNTGGTVNTVNFSLPDSLACPGSLMKFTNLSSDTAGWTAAWYQGYNNYEAGTSFSNSINATTSYTPGTYVIMLLMTDSAGCQFVDFKNFTGQFLTNPNPTIVFQGQDTVYEGQTIICNGGSVILSTDSTYSHYSWSTGSSSASITVHNTGDYMVTVTGLNGCTAWASQSINVDSPVINITFSFPATSKCEGDAHILAAQQVNGGSWDIAFYHWSNGLNTYSDTVSPLVTTTYYVTCTDLMGCTAKAGTTVTVLPNQPPVINPGPNQTLAGCGTDTLGGNPTASGGTTPYTYRWSPYNGLSNDVAANPVVSNIYTPTTYTLIVTDSLGCTDTGRVTITPLLTTPFTPPVATISRCELSCQLDSDFTYQWYHGGLPISGATAPTYSEDSTGYYNAVVTSTIYPLCRVSSNYISVNPYQNQEICIVTLDSTNTYNLVIWDNPAGQDIASFRIYKLSDSTSQYVLLGEQPYNQFSTYTDTTSNPSQLSSTYGITIVDSCGNESHLSPVHTTILLSSNQGINNTVNLSWNAYEGFTYNNFEIWRSANGGPMTLLTTVANTTLAYVDNSPPAQAYYQIRVTNSNGCNPARSAFDYSTVRSNIVNNTSTGIQNINSSVQDLIIYPNPSAGLVNVKLNGPYTGPATLRVSDVLGRIVKEQPVETKADLNMNINLTSAGTYFIELVTTDGLVGKGIVTVQ